VKTAIVTSSDIRYIPGVKGLYMSYLANANHKGDFYLLAHGAEEEFKEFEYKDIKILYNKDTINSPTSCFWPVKLPAMYSRLLIPRLFKNYDRVLFLDADTIILRDLNPLLETEMNGTPCAGMTPGRQNNNAAKAHWMPHQFENPENFPEYKDIHAIQAGVLLFHIKNWNSINLDQKVDETLVSDIKFKFVVQGLLGYVLRGAFTHLHYTWNTRLSYTNNLKNINILHYTGGDKNDPWADPKIKFKNVWQKYHDQF